MAQSANPASITALGSNSQPAGGVVATSPVQPGLTPADLAALIQELQGPVQKLRAASSPQQVPLAVTQDVVGGVANTSEGRISSVGLGTHIVSVHTAEISIDNTTAAAVTIPLSPLFPFNLLQKTTIQINGGATTYSASGVSGLSVWARRKRGILNPRALSTGGYGMSRSYVQSVTVSGTGTLTAAAADAPTLSGYASVTVPTVTTVTLTAKFVTVEPLVNSLDDMIGTLILQNNSTFANLTRTPATKLTSSGAEANATPLYDVAAGVTATWSSFTHAAQYKFFGIPSDPALYQAMIGNSYQVQEQPNVAVSGSGDGALTYDIPTNIYLLAAHILHVDSVGALVPIPANLTALQLQYSAGAVIPVRQDEAAQQAIDEDYYGHDYPTLLPGMKLWDGNATADTEQNTDSCGWMDTYDAATPQLLETLNGTDANFPYSLTVCREQVVAAAVTTVGG